MTKKTYGQKNVVTTNLKDYTKEQAQAKGKIFYKAWLDFEYDRIEKNRQNLEKSLDKRTKK